MDPSDVVGRDILVRLHKMGAQRGLASRARYAGFGIHDHVVRPNPSFLQKRGQRQNRSGGIAPRIAHETRAFDLLPIKLRQAIHGRLQKLRSRMRQMIPLGVCLGCIHPEIRAQIHHSNPPLAKPRHQRHRLRVCATQKHHVHLHALRVRKRHQLLISDARHLRIHLGKPLSGLTPRNQENNLRLGMTRQQAKQR